MKKLFVTLSLVFATQQALACADGGGEDYYYYNLFSQTLIQAPQYTPFLMTMDEAFFSDTTNAPNENISAWQKSLDISYAQAEYLVFKAKKEEVDQLIKGQSVQNAQLKFATAAWSKKNKQALLYLSYAKYLEPFMAYYYIDNDEWSYVSRPEKTAKQLDSNKVINVLIKSWNAETDKEMKMRYGYQLVRWAHYTRDFVKAKTYFNEYVESLGIKNVMYYYALDQKAGAERALDNFIQANYDFFEVFSHSNDRKLSAYSSMRVTQDLDYQQLLKKAKTNQERSDLYLLIGYKDFSNPLAAMKKIVEKDADAVQAKVLFARSINLLEREYLRQSMNPWYWRKDEQKKKAPDLFIPTMSISDYSDYQPLAFSLNEAIEMAKNQASITKDKAYWNLSLSYLSLISKDFKSAKNYLTQVKTTDKALEDQKNAISMLVEIFEIKTITPAFEDQLMAKYGHLINFTYSPLPENQWQNPAEEEQQMRYKNIVVDVLANRYFMQGDKAKAFLLHNGIDAFGSNPDWALLEDLEKFNAKKNKTNFEKYLFSNVGISYWDLDTKTHKKNKATLTEYLANYKGTLYLREQKFDLAKKEFQKIGLDFEVTKADYAYYDYYSDNTVTLTGQYDGYKNISSRIFGYNKIECFNCEVEEVMETPYLNEFKFIKNKMNKLELTTALIELDKLAHGKSEQAARANYLLGNFYYNTTTLGYFRELLSFDTNNQNGPKFNTYNYRSLPEDNNKQYQFYYKDYAYHNVFNDRFSPSENYLTTALGKTTDNELKAKILFALSKNEQGRFYTTATDKGLNLLLENEWNNRQQIDQYQQKHYKNYFKELKKYSTTQAYKEAKSNCQYFAYYAQNY